MFVNLKSKKVNHETLQKMFDLFPNLVKKTDFNKEAYIFDNNIYFDGKSKVLCRSEYLSFVLRDDIGMDDYKHILINLDEEQIENIKDDITGMQAYTEMCKVLERSYTEKEIDDILGSYTDEYSDDLKQWHYCEYEIGEIIEFDDVVKYDINGAHADALVEMFPKADKDLRELYAKRKDAGMEEVKAYFNYTVGMFKRIGYTGAYNHIVQRTTKKLMDLYKKIGGIIVYVNTDGIAVSKPTAKIIASKELGQFKLEYEGKTWTYGGSNYYAVQWGDNDLKGSSCLKSVRHLIDLSKGKVINYKRIRNEYGLYEASEIGEIQL